MTGDKLASFMEAMARRGIASGHIIPDGKLHRCDTTARNGSGDAAYVLYMNGIAHGGFQNWQDGQGWEDWQSGEESSLSWEQRQSYYRAVQEQRRQRDEESARRRESAAQSAQKLWTLGAEIQRTDVVHPYLERKHVGAHGIRSDGGRLLVPAWGMDGVLHTLQTIDISGQKLYLPGGSVQGHFHVVGVPRESTPLLIAEGYATAASLHESTGYPVIVTFQANNLLPVAQAWRERMPTARIAVCADDDWKTVVGGRPTNVGVIKATEAAQAIAGFLIVPKFVKNRVDKDTDFNDLAISEGPDAVRRQIESVINNRLVHATPFTWMDESTIPPRAWLYGRHLIRRHVSLTIAPGAMGKSSLLIGDAIAMASGKDLLNSYVHPGRDGGQGDDRGASRDNNRDTLSGVSSQPGVQGHRVWYWNLEDPADELQRRFIAAIRHYGVEPESLADRLFVDSGRQQGLTMARQDRGETIIMEPIVDAVIKEIKERKIDVLIVDPFVSCHTVPENDNGAVDAVIKRWAKVADECDCAIELVHHSRKLGGGEATAESSRGASALLAAARSVRVLNRMTKEEAEEASVPTYGKSGHLSYFRVSHDKENLTPASPESSWFHFLSVELANGDNVGVIEPWKWPSAFDGISASILPAVQRAVSGKGLRYDSRSEEWVGFAVARIAGLDHQDMAARAQIRRMVDQWIQNAVLRKIEVVTERRQTKVAIEVGRWVEGFVGATVVDEEL